MGSDWAWQLVADWEKHLDRNLGVVLDELSVLQLECAWGQESVALILAPFGGLQALADGAL